MGSGLHRWRHTTSFRERPVSRELAACESFQLLAAEALSGGENAVMGLNELCICKR